MAQSAQWERVETAIRREVPDRPPFGLWMHVPEIGRDPVKLARFTVDLTERYKMDYVLSGPAVDLLDNLAIQRAYLGQSTASNGKTARTACHWQSLKSPSF